MITIEYQDKYTPEQRLWWAVLWRAVMDYAPCEQQHQTDRNTAAHFLFHVDAKEHLTLICHLAQTSVEYVRELALRWKEVRWKHCFFCLAKTRHYGKLCLNCKTKGEHALVSPLA